MLQRLIDEAQPDDTVIVPDGIYHGPFRLSKTVHLRPETPYGVTIETRGGVPPFIISADAGNCTVQYFRFESDAPIRGFVE